MGNAQHSSDVGEWYTPLRWTSAASRALGGIDLDPCSSPAANATVQARMYYGAQDSPLDIEWHLEVDMPGFLLKTAFVNPPGSCCSVPGEYPGCGNTLNSGKPRTKCSCALPREFMARSVIEAWHGMDIIYLAYSVNQLRQLSRIGVSKYVTVSVALPATRIAYLDPNTLQPVKGTNCDSAFICLSKDPTMHKRFAKEFKAEGCEVYTSCS